MEIKILSHNSQTLSRNIKSKFDEISTAIQAIRSTRPVKQFPLFTEPGGATDIECYPWLVQFYSHIHILLAY